MTNGEKFKNVFGFGVDGSRVIAVNATWWDCEFQNRKLITNADRIRNMTDEELAKWIERIRILCADDACGNACPLIDICYSKAVEPTETLDWLKQKTEEGE